MASVATLSLLVRKEKGPGGEQGLLEVGHEILVYWHGCETPALGRVVLVRALDEQYATLQIDVPLLEGKHFTLAQPAKQARREQAPPRVGQGLEHPGDFLDRERAARATGLAPALGAKGWVFSRKDKQPVVSGELEDLREAGADAIDRAGPHGLLAHRERVLELAEVLSQFYTRHFGDGQLPEPALLAVATEAYAVMVGAFEQ